jgi:hypothetical protein
MDHAVAILLFIKGRYFYKPYLADESSHCLEGEIIWPLAGKI